MEKTFESRFEPKTQHLVCKTCKGESDIVYYTKMRKVCDECRKQTSLRAHRNSYQNNYITKKELVGLFEKLFNLLEKHDIVKREDEAPEEQTEAEEEN